MNDSEWCHETILQSVVFFRKLRDFSVAMFSGFIRDLQQRRRKSQRKTSHLKSLRFSNFFYRDYFNSLKTSNICKYSGIEFLGPNPKLRRRKKNLSWGGYVLHKTELPVREFHVTKCATSRAKFFFCQSLVAVAVIVEKAS